MSSPPELVELLYWVRVLLYSWSVPFISSTAFGSDRGMEKQGEDECPNEPECELSELMSEYVWRWHSAFQSHNQAAEWQHVLNLHHCVVNDLLMIINCNFQVNGWIKFRHICIHKMCHLYCFYLPPKFRTKPLPNIRCREHITPDTTKLHWPLIFCRIQFHLFPINPYMEYCRDPEWKNENQFQFQYPTA